MKDDTYVRLLEQSREQLSKTIRELGKNGGEFGLGANISVAGAPFALPGTIVTVLLDLTKTFSFDAPEAYEAGGFRAATITVVLAVVLNSLDLHGGMADDVIPSSSLNMARDGVTPVVRTQNLLGEFYATHRARLLRALRSGNASEVVDAIHDWWRKAGLSIIDDYRSIRIGSGTSKGGDGTIAYVELNGKAFWGHNAEMKAIARSGMPAVGLGWDKDLTRKMREYYSRRGVFDNRVPVTHKDYKTDLEISGILKNGFGHAEMQAIYRAVDDAVKNEKGVPKTLVVVVDRMPCGSCQWVLERMRQYWGIQEIVLLWRDPQRGGMLGSTVLPNLSN